MSNTKYKHKFEKIMFLNRWILSEYARSDDWVLIGISTWWGSPQRYQWRLSFFGLELRFIFSRKTAENLSEKPVTK